MKLYVRKVWSLNPTKHKYIELDRATKQYREYIKSFWNSDCKKKDIKTFDSWLKTEI